MSKSYVAIDKFLVDNSLATLGNVMINGEYLGGLNTSGVPKGLIGVNASDLVSIDPDALGVVTGARLNVATTLSVGAETHKEGALYVADSSAFAFQIFGDKFGNDNQASGLFLRKARGTVTSPTQVLSGDNIGALLVRGYHSGGAFGTTNVGAILVVATENFTAAAQGTQLVFGTTPNGSVNRVNSWILSQAGNLAPNGDNTYNFGSLTNRVANAFGVLGTFNTIVMNNGTDPVTSPADTVQLFSTDISAGNASLGIRTETAVAADVAVASTHSLSVTINGTVYKILLATP